MVVKRIYGLLLILLLSNISTTFGQWLKVEAINQGSIYSLWSAGDTLFAGGDSVLFYSFDGGVSWGRGAKVPDVEYGITTIAPVKNGLYIGTSLKGVFFTSDMGNSWEDRSGGLTGLGAKEISDFAIRGNEIFVSTIGGGVYKNSLITPGDWTLFSDGIPWNTGWSVACIKNIDGDLFAGGGVNGFYYVNKKNTSTWTEVPFDWFNGEANGILAFEKSGNKLVASSHQAIYTSLDEGATWTKFPLGIGLIENSDISVKGNNIVVLLSKASRYYIYYSSDNGASWWRNDMQSGNVSYAMNLSAGKIWVGRLDGLYYKLDTITGIGDGITTPELFSLSQNYPNPFNPTTKIDFTLGLAGEISLKVYDMLGNETVTLTDGYFTSGNHSVLFSGDGFSSGVYYYSLITPLGRKTGKMTLLK
ncbi:hypothetical protein MASR1M107_14050 [Ignavibacteriales bacterium]